MFGLVPFTSLMDATVCRPQRHTFRLNLPLNSRQKFSGLPILSEAEPILEDTPDILDEDVEVDYSVCPPDVGKNVIVDELGSELTLGDTPSKQKRVVCSFSSNSPDPDEYPFDAVTYGESTNYLGLLYNDHSYIKSGPPSHTPADDDRLSLLAKLALAKDSKQINGSGGLGFKPRLQTGLGLVISNDTLTPSAKGHRQPSTDVFPGVLTQTLSLNPLSMTTVANNASTRTGPHHTLVTTNSRHSAVGSRTFVLSPTNSVSTGSSLQVHRVSSSLTPHLVLRTGVPALQITTTATRTSIPSSAEQYGIVRCPCCLTHIDGSMLQCEQCRTWQHSKCVSSTNGVRAPSPYICTQCQLQLSTTASSVVTQRHKISTASANPKSSVRISRSDAFNCLGNSGQIVFTSIPGNSSVRQSHLCLPGASGLSASQVNRADFTTVPSVSDLASVTPCYFNVVSHPPPVVAHNQTVRSSKRKQDLMTLSGVSHNVGLECLADSPNPDGLLDLEAVANLGDLQTPYIETSSNSRSAENDHFVSTFLPTTSTTVHALTKSGSSLHRLLMHDGQQHSGSGYQLDVVGGTLATSSSSSVSSDSMPSPLFDTYEEASDLRLSERFFLKLGSLFPSHCSSSDFTELAAYLHGDSPPKLPALKKFQVVNFDFNRKGLVASSDFSLGEPVVEYRGLCMLMSEYSEVYDYRRHYNPFVLFYKNWSKIALCIDARKFGNEARFIRRSCTPNCEVRHFITVCNDLQSGPTPRIRLVIFATRPISRSTELTLPFDFDYTTCRYLVKCACARKACPVARWFRQTSILDGSEPRSSANSLLYSRKLSFTPRGSGPGSRPRGFATATQDNYSDILADDCNRMDHIESSNWMDSRLDVENAHSVKIRPHRTFKRLSRPNDSITKHNSLLKSIRPHAQDSSATDDRVVPGDQFRAADEHKGNTRRGRPPSKDTQLASSLPKSSYYKRRARRKAIANSKMAGAVHSFPPSSADKMRMKNGISADDATQMPQSPSSQCPRGSTRDTPVRRCSTTTELGGVHGLNLDTLQSSPVSRSPVSPNMQTADSNSTRSKQSKTIDEKDSFVATSSSSDAFDQLTTTKSGRSLSSENGARSKPLSDKDLETSSSRRIPSSQANENKKSREEIWMAEVLRRIERMERKQRQQQQRRRHTLSELGTVEPVSATSFEPTAESHSSEQAHYDVQTVDHLVSNSGADIDNDQSVGPLVETLSDTRFDLTCSNDPTDFDVDDDVKWDADSVATHPAEDVSINDFADSTVHDVTVDRVESDSVVVCDASADSVQASYPAAEYHTKPCARSVYKSTSKRLSSTSQKNASTDRSSPSKRRRRRSQTTLLSDGLSDSLGSDHQDTREDRWLKSQLRRIAELEVRTVSQQVPGEPTENGSATIDSKSPTDVVFQNTALKEVSNHEASMDLSYPNSCNSSGTAGHRIESSEKQSPIILGRSKRRRPSIRLSPSAEPGLSDVTCVPSHLGSSSDENFNLPKHSPELTNAEADCELIVYRPREKDPMAKFSRSRSTVVSEHTPVFTSQENTPPFPGEPDYTNVSVYSTASRTNPLTHSTLRPTKKRWLCQYVASGPDTSMNAYSIALMEEDGDILSSGATATEDRSVDCTVVSESHSSSPPPVSVAPTACPMNPKKRIISQFSEMGGDFYATSPNRESNSDPRIDANHSDLVNPDSTASAGSVDLSKPQSSDSIESADCCFTPSPPKKVAVKHQAEAMRKVRVSLSEYRRRRGLSFSSSTVNKSENGCEQRTMVKNTTKAESHLSHQLPSPTRLLDEIPRLYQQFQLPDKHLTSSQEGRQLVSNSTESTTNLPQLGRAVVTSKRILPSEDHSDERGPRTPSEPLDDDDTDGTNTVYVRRSSKSSMDTVPEVIEGSSGQRLTRFSSSQLDVPVGEPSLANAFSPDLLSFGSKKDPCTLSPLPHLDTGTASKRDDVAPSNSTPVDGTANMGFSRSNDSDSQKRFNPPPIVPPPPPLPTSTTNRFVDYAHHQFDATLHQPVYSVSEPTCSKPHVYRTSLDYFIRRDQEIRHWQETRSFEREHKRPASRYWGAQPISGSLHALSHHQRPLVSHRSASSRDTSRRNHYNDAYAIPDVELTLNRLHDSLRTQLDRTKQALTPRSTTPVADRTPSIHRGGDVLAGDFFTTSDHSTHRRFPSHSHEKWSNRSAVT